MRTRRTILVIVLAATTGVVGIVVLLVATLGWYGLLLAVFGIVAVSGVYRLWIQPWQHHWGATADEVRRAMPGDYLILDAAITTRAISIRAPTEEVWPWLVQLGYGRGGWYSYDRIDNDGQPSADHSFMERKMLKSIRSRAERAVHAREAAAGTRRLLGVHRARTWWVQGQRSVPTGS